MGQAIRVRSVHLQSYLDLFESDHSFPLLKRFFKFEESVEGSLLLRVISRFNLMLKLSLHD